MKQDILTRSKKRKAETLLMENRLMEAKELCEQIVKTNRTDAEALVLLGIAYRRLGSHSEAVSRCRQALQLSPRLPEAHHALGAALHSQGKMQEAMECYQNAIRLRPDYLDAYYLLGNALRETGQLEQAATYYRKALKLNPDHVPSLCNLGGALAGLHHFDEAAVHLNKANKLQPGTIPVLCNMARILQLLKRPAEAEARCREALQHDPRAVDVMVMLADLLEKSSRLDEAREIVERGLKLVTGHAGLGLTAARLARREGRPQDAIALALAALAANPTADRQSELHHLLGQLYDREGDTVKAFAHFSEGNRITARAAPDSDRHSYLRHLEQRRTQFRSALPVPTTAVHLAVEMGEKSPVFLVGFPRSGTTLLEQILDSHPQLQALDERPTVSIMLQAYERIVQRRGEAAVSLTDAEIRELRNTYFAEAGRHLKRASERTLVDKMPLNLVEVHFIWRVFPDAKFILALRHPCDVCLSCFMQNFSLNQAMSTFTSLQDTAAAYAAVFDLWQEYTKNLPLQYHMIRYEDVVENMEREARQLLAFLEIEWNDAVLGHVEHAKRRGTISTPSYHQVTQPIYKSARYRWKRYAHELEPVMQTLRPYIELFGYSENS